VFFVFVLFLKGDLEGAHTDGNSIQLDIERVVSSVGQDEGAGVGTVEVVLCGDHGGGAVGLMDGEGVKGKDDGVAILVSGLDDNGEVLVVGQRGIGSGQDTEGVGGIFDGLSFEVDFNLDGASLVGRVADGVGTIVVVDDFVGNVGFLGTSDLDDERIATITSGVAFVINGVDGELSGFVVEDLSVSDTITGGIRSVGVARPFDLGVEGSILDGFAMEVDIDGISSRFFDLVLDRVGTIAVVTDIGGDGLRTSDFDLEGISSFLDGVAVGIDRVDGESKGMLGLSVGQTVAFGIRSAGVGVLDQRAVRRTLDGGSVEGDIDLVSSRMVGGVCSLVGSVLGVIELDEDGGASGVLDGDSEVITSGRNVATVLVDRLDGEGGGTSNASAFNTRTVGI